MRNWGIYEGEVSLSKAKVLCNDSRGTRGVSLVSERDFRGHFWRVPGDDP